MATILVISDYVQALKAEVGQPLKQLYPHADIRFCLFDDVLLNELANGLQPILILMDMGADNLMIMNELRSFACLARTPMLMLRAGATKRKVEVENDGLGWLYQSLNTPSKYQLN
ncbi:hypothetical protein DYU11_19290 [Fibrisoma montanum]|uniref:Response regulator n=1 Tax=Fibrisoma montanum TaxID=2305895 RepID=A0A418M6K3_9BACT|nr:hypothetical protein [Fibrisoma montanum]RIV21547.1 hypothetical protein DYU11_19290 [Fibrisoma montanum]